MRIYEGKELEKYKNEILKINPAWKRRDFTYNTKHYLNSSTEKILAIGGLRGTGKTVGILQAAEGYDAVYVLTQEREKETSKDYIDFLEKTDKKYIIFDEYSWIKDREQLDRFLLTAVQNGKRIVITGTESITLDFLNYGALNHRVDMLHTTMVKYDEFLRLNDMQHSKASCEKYLTEGGLFKEYALKNYDSTREYIFEAIVKNLAGYLKSDMSEEKATTLTYSVLYKAICPSNLSTVPQLRQYGVTLENFLDKMGVNTTIIPESKDLNRVADIFEQIGLIVRIPNFDEESGIKEQYYITNPSLTCQLIKAAYDLDKIENYVLGHVFESTVAVQLAINKLEGHDIYFYNNGNQQDNPNNKEMDVILADRNKEAAYLFEVKYRQKDTLSSDNMILSGYLEKHELKDAEIEGRYVVYNGKPSVKEYEIGSIIFTPPTSRALDYYFEFEKNMDDIRARQHTIDHNLRNDAQSNDNEVDEEIKHTVNDIMEKAETMKAELPALISKEKGKIVKSEKQKIEHETIQQHRHNFLIH